MADFMTVYSMSFGMKTTKINEGMPWKYKITSSKPSTFDNLFCP